MARTRLQDCRTEAERREQYPQLCTIADSIERAGGDRTDLLLNAVRWILQQRKREAAQAAGVKTR